MPTGRTAFKRNPPLYGHYAAIRQTGEQFMDQATLMDKIKTGTTLCKAIMRNGYDAYAINAPLQGLIFEKTGVFDVDIACACDTETLFKIFPNAVPYTEEGAMAMLQENGVTLRFYSTDVEDASHPEMSQLRITPRLARLLAELQLKGQLKSSNTNDPEAKEFEDFDNRILDYVPAREIMEEWRKVAAESMWKFVQLLFEAQLLHGLMPEIAALSCIKQERNDDGDIESVFDHTIECMKRYPEEGFSMDWYGTLATMFHDVGKLYTAEHLNGRWTFYQHHRVGAGVTRKILRRLHFTSEDIDLICHLVRHHMMFHFMLTDRGIRRFKALPETERLIAMCRADIEARDGSYTYFNHNSKYLTRAETDELLLEPLLNGNEIMEYTSLPPGPAVGTIREALLKAQVAGEVTDRDSAIAFVKNYAAKLK